MKLPYIVARIVRYDAQYGTCVVWLYTSMTFGASRFRCWRYLIEEKDADARSIVLFGRSLGGAVATWIAAKENPGALIVESTFVSVPEMGAKLYPILPVRLLARVHYNSAERMGRIEAPQLFIHSRDDEIIPFEQGVALYEQANEPKTFIEIRGSHNSGFLDSGADYIAPLQAFLRAIEEGVAG